MENAGQVVTELQDMRDDGFLSDALLRAAVRRIKQGSDRYDWVGVYLLNDEGNELWLHNYIGSGTEHAKIPVGTGVCGTAVAERANQIVDDVSTVENYLACNTLVSSEMVVLIRAGEDIYGQIDIDSYEPGAFSTEDETSIQLVADKLAEQIAEERR